jgi:hypothetical protein
MNQGVPSSIAPTLGSPTTSLIEPFTEQMHILKDVIGREQSLNRIVIGNALVNHQGVNADEFVIDRTISCRVGEQNTCLLGDNLAVSRFCFYANHRFIRAS